MIICEYNYFILSNSESLFDNWEKSSCTQLLLSRRRVRFEKIEKFDSEDFHQTAPLAARTMKENRIHIFDENINPGASGFKKTVKNRFNSFFSELPEIQNFSQRLL